jgi:hypothetical protein
MTVGRRDGHAYLDLMEREHGVVGRLLAHGVLDKRIPPLWESRPADFPLPLSCSTTPPRSSSTRAMSGTTRAQRIRGADRGRPAPGLARSRRRARARRLGDHRRLLRAS